MRVQIPVYTDRWVMGDRYGEVIKVTRRKSTVGHYGFEDVALVRLDSGKKVRVILDDCTEV